MFNKKNVFDRFRKPAKRTPVRIAYLFILKDGKMRLSRYLDWVVRMRSHRMPFFRRIRKRICDLRLYEFFTAGKTQNPKTDFWLYKVRAQQEPAPGAQYILYGRFENHGGEFFKHQREPISSWHESLPAAPCSPPSQGNCGAFARLVSPGCRVLRNLAVHQPTPRAPQEIF